MTDPAHRNEAARLAALHRYDVLDTAPEESFDRITRIAKCALQVPIVLVSLVDANRQWFKSKQGLEVCETPRNISFCTHAIERDTPLLIADALADERFRDNPLVTGEPSIRFYCGMPLRTPDGHNIGTLCAIDRKPRGLSNDQMDVLRDLARMAIDELELRQIATTDSLTGAQSRRSFVKDATKELERAKRYSHPASLIMLDIDHFKQVNDGHGHAAGDVVLCSVAAMCTAHLRSADILARVGGEEFAIVLPEADRLGAMEVAEKLRRKIAQTPITVSDRQIDVTASFGVTIFDDADTDVRTIIERADAALYRAKEAGRNRIVYSGGGEPLPDVA